VNISFVLVLSGYSYSASIIPTWYPGDDVVDWAGADSYNFGACSATRPPWRSFATAVGPFRTWGAAHNKPQVLAEWGSAEDSTTPGRKAQWITDAGTYMQSWTELHAASYFDEKGSCDWSLDTSASANAAFKALALSAGANAGATARLSATGLTGLQQVWTGAASTGSHHVTGTGVSSWTLSAGDGTVSTSGIGQPAVLSHLYAKTGTYTATLTITDDSGASATTTSKVSVA
jgi:hypothetical protein